MLAAGAVFAALTAAGGAARAEESCFPDRAPANLIGRYFVHERVVGMGAVQTQTAVIAGRSDAGGLITCFYDGRPGALGSLRSVLATDARYNFAWSVDAASGVKSVASAQARGCDLGLGPCEIRRPLPGPNQPTEIRPVDRFCENGAFVKIQRRPRYEGGAAAVRAHLTDRARRRAERRVEIRYRADGAILGSVQQIGPRRGAPSLLVEEGDWAGPSCAPGVS